MSQPTYTDQSTAMSVTIRSTLFPRMALQVHPSYLERPHVAQLPLPELQGGSGS
jgi:hypothetical protein